MDGNLDARAAGWRTFAGVLILLVAVFNFIDGIVAIANTHYLNSHLVFGTLTSWGWTILILGGIEFIVGIGVLAGQKWAAWAGIAFATLNAIGQLLYLPSYPVWSIIIISIDVLVIYGLAMYVELPGTE